MNCQQPSSERTSAYRGQQITEFNESVANSLPVIQDESALNGRRYSVIQDLENVWPKRTGETLEKASAVAGLRYQAWKLKADALIFIGISTKSTTPDKNGYIEFIARGKAIKFLK
jgi:uncharacterized protein YbjQ (UPF0145 family)